MDCLPQITNKGIQSRQSIFSRILLAVTPASANLDTFRRHHFVQEANIYILLWPIWGAVPGPSRGCKCHEGRPSRRTEDLVGAKDRIQCAVVPEKEMRQGSVKAN